MRTGSVAYADQKIEEAQERAAQQKDKPQTQPVVLYFYDGLQVLLRPLADLNSAILANKHFKWNASTNTKTEAICAKEFNKPCELCERAKEDRELTAKEFWYLPVYVYQVVRTKDRKTGKTLPTPELVQYKDEDEVLKPVRGIRVLELSEYGAIGTVFKYIRMFMADSTNGPLTGRDFLLAQEGKGQGQKSFLFDKKDPKAMDPRLARAIPPMERVFERIAETMPPRVSTSAVAIVPCKGDDPAISSFVQGVKNAQAATSTGDDDDLPEF